MFSDFAVWYLFFAGTAAGSFVIAAALDYFGNSFANMRFVSLMNSQVDKDSVSESQEH